MNNLFFIIVIDTKNDIEEKIKSNCFEMNKTKLETTSFFCSKINKLDKKLILKDNLNDFGNLSTYIPPFFEYLWENPKLVSELVMNCDVNDIKENLANFFMNNFYENILSNNYLESNLMYVLTLLIKEEINNLNNIDDCDKLMNDNSKLGYFMDEFKKKTDIKNYFKASFLNLISELESNSFISLSLNVQEIINKFKNKENLKKRVSLKLKEEDESNISVFDYLNFDNKELGELVGKYLLSLTVTELKNMMSQSEITNKDMNDYLNNIIKNSKDEFSYSNQKLMEKFDVDNISSDKVIYIYIKKFYLIKEFIDKFILILKNDLDIIPYSIKCFCKIINVLIQKKFPDINSSQKNAFISKFFFKKIIKPILANPSLELLINDFIISGTTERNLNTINDILSQLFSGKLFENNDNIHLNNYTPFNWYFLEKMPEIFEIFLKLTDVELPFFIDDLINDKLDSNFTYDYFELNKEEKIMHYSICFCYNDLKNILDGFSKLKDKIDITRYKNGINLLKTFERLNSDKNRKTLDALYKKNNSKSFFIVRKSEKENLKKSNTYNYESKDKDIGKDLSEMEVENYYLIQELNASKEYKDLLKIKSDSKNNFNLKKIKTVDNPETKNKNIIIKIKNFFSDLLFNYGQLQRNNFSKSNINNTSEILNSIQIYSKLSDFNKENINIPIEWYCKSIINLIKNISEDYTKNDLEKLYNEMEDEISNSINSYNIDFLCEYINRLKNIEKEQLYYKEIANNINDLELNQKSIYIIEKKFIPVKITFNYKEENFSFSISKFKIKKEEFDKFELKEKAPTSKLYERYCKSIKSFIENFPDFSIFQKKQDIDILQLQKNLSVPKKIKDYVFSIIQEQLLLEQKKQKENNIDLDQIENKIYDYILKKINKKIFPKTYDEDDKIFQNSFKLSWIEPKHLIQKETDFIFDAFLPEVIQNFHILEKEQSPRKKILILSEIFELISKLVLFNGGDSNLGVDDQIPILSYCFIKAQPKTISSNVKFIKLYRDSLIEKGNENELTQLIALCEFVKNISYQNLNEISEEEFIKNCNKVIYSDNC